MIVVEEMVKKIKNHGIRSFLATLFPVQGNFERKEKRKQKKEEKEPGADS